jgi:hypothetical protein
MRIPPLVPLAAALGATLLACHEAPTAPIAVTLQLDRDSYRPALTGVFDFRSFRMVVQYHNGTGSPVYCERCWPSDTLPVYGVPTADGVHRSGYDRPWACPNSPALTFPAGASRTDTLLISGPTAYDGQAGAPLGVMSGSFRLEYRTRACAEDRPACYQPGPRVASAPFQVLVPWKWVRYN